MARTPWIVFLLRVSDAQGELGEPGKGTLVAWCLMPQVLKKHPHLANPDGHVGDGISLTGGKFNFTDFSETEMSLEGLMFYSTDPSSGGHVLTSKGTTVPRGGRLTTRITTNPTLAWYPRSETRWH